MANFLLAIDQGTTSTRAIVYDGKLNPKSSAQKEFNQFFPAPGWVEHDPEEIWASVVATCRAAIKKARPADWRGVQAREQEIKAAIYSIVKDVTETERLFAIVYHQREY